MSIESEITVELARVEVSDDYRIEVTVTDPDTHTTATVALLWGQAEQLADEIGDALAEADGKLHEDRAAIATHLFDVDGPGVSA